MSGSHSHDHDHGGHGHGHHDHGHSHHDHHHHGIGGHAREAGRKSLTIVLVLTGTFMVAEFVGGILSNSLALLADAAHMLTDVAAIGLSLFALWFSQRPATPEKTYGYQRIEILAALLNGVTLSILSLFIFREAWERFADPVQVRGGLMLAVATAGLVVNIIAAYMLHASAGENLNVRGAYLHVLGDLLGSVGAITAAIVILTTGWSLADPLISVGVATLILISSYRLVRESVDVLLEATPRHLDVEEIRDEIAAVAGVEGVHDLHVWTVTSGFIAMSGHCHVASPDRIQPILGEIHDRMHDRFGIRHVTIQVEPRPLFQIGDDGAATARDAGDRGEAPSEHDADDAESSTQERAV